MNDTAANKALERLLAVDWEYNDARQESHVALMTEYLRRATLWVMAFNISGKGRFFNLAGIIMPDVSAPQHLIDEVEELPANWWGRRICTWYLLWAMIKDHPEVTKLDLPDLYEPLIRLYERGGSFTMEHTFIDVGSAGIPAVRWSDFESLEPLPDLGDATLDRIDAKAAKPELVTP